VRVSDARLAGGEGVKARECRDCGCVKRSGSGWARRGAGQSALWGWWGG